MCMLYQILCLILPRENKRRIRVFQSVDPLHLLFIWSAKFPLQDRPFYSDEPAERVICLMSESVCVNV